MRERAEHVIEGRHAVADLPGEAIKPGGFTMPAEVARRAALLTPYDRRPDQADLLCRFKHGPRVQLWFLHKVPADQAPEVHADYIEQTLPDGTRERVWFGRVHNRTYEHAGQHYRRFMRITLEGTI